MPRSVLLWDHVKLTMERLARERIELGLLCRRAEGADGATPAVSRSRFYVPLGGVTKSPARYVPSPISMKADQK